MYAVQVMYTGADPGFGNGRGAGEGGPGRGGGCKISSDASYIYEQSEYKSGWGGGVRRACKPTQKKKNLEPLRVNLSVI